jgi:hypothetical protein
MIMRKIITIIIIIFSSLSAIAQWSQTAKVISSDRYLSDVFGHALSVDDSVLISGAPMQDSDSNTQNVVADAGAAYIFLKDSMGNWQESQKICASDRHVEDYFGTAVAVDANTIIVGADQTDINNSMLHSSGSAYIFEKGGDSKYVQMQKIEASDRKANAYFGQVVDLSGDFAIIGSPDDYTDSLNLSSPYKAGSAYIFEKDSTGTWAQVQKLTAPDADTLDHFGISVSIYNNTAIVGACYHQQNSVGLDSLPGAGAAYIYQRSANGRWNLKQKIVNNDRNSGDLFGKNVSIFGDYIFVSSKNNTDSLGNNPIMGASAIYVFKKDNNGDFVQWQKLCAYDRAAALGFACAVDLNNQYAIIGAQYVHGPYYGYQIGAAYAYNKSSNGKWYFEQKLVANEDEANDYFGRSVALNSQTIFISSNNGYDAIGNNYQGLAGSVYVFGKTSVGIASAERMEVEYGPNPSHGYFEINLQKEMQIINLEVYNMLGQKVFEHSYYNTKQLQLNLQLAKGMYIVALQSELGNLARIKLNIDEH